MSLAALKTKARKAIMAGKYEAALNFYAEIHKEEPSDLRMFTKLAEMKEKTGDLGGAVRDYTKIAKQYADEGFVVQAIAINKLILRLDPEQTEIKQRLRHLSSERGEDWALSTIISSDIAQTSKSKSSRIPLLSGLSGQELDDFIESLELQEFSEGDAIYNKGDVGDILYIIGMGEVHLETENARGNKQIFSKLSEGDFFGELAFMSKKDHVDSAIAKSDGNVLLLNRKNFDEWVKKYPSIHDTVEDFYRQRVLARILAITPVFEKIPSEARIPLAQKFSFSFFKANDTIIKEGDVEDTFFLIRSGRVKISTINKKDTSKNIILGTLSEGSFFGEVSMLTKMPRTATVTAVGAVELMVLTGDKFLDIAKTYPTVKQVVEAYLKQRVKSTIKKMNA
ncbi:MAG TPA: cyclic nucleotide-binding domain-containing protein [Ghiorsea sp.]|nr:cyclic nucleotide-binding domain-containing protein [Ghiorsea sp.]HIP07764.1 cyclic nucleotide-binding domain-containing protein [Mariprofundaceae bacterium]